MSLIFWNVLLYFFGKLKYGLLMAIAISLLIGYDTEVDEFLSLSRTFFFFPFFLAGYHLKEEHFVRLKSRMNTVLGIIVAIVGFILIARYAPLDYRFWLLGKRPYEEIADTIEYSALMRLATYGVQFLATFVFLTLVPKNKAFLLPSANRPWSSTCFIWGSSGFTTIIPSSNTLSKQASIGYSLYQAF